jgi:hypothetical protein
MSGQAGQADAEPRRLRTGWDVESAGPEETGREAGLVYEHRGPPYLGPG